MKTIKVKDILSISGKGGLFKFIAQARNGIVVESLEESKRHVAPATARISSLDDIDIFTEEEEVPLADVFMVIHKMAEGKESISHKASNDELKEYFREIIPEYDEDRVYVSDIRKVILWYNLLHEHNLLEVIEKEEESDIDDEDKKEKPDAEDTQKENSK